MKKTFFVAIGIASGMVIGFLLGLRWATPPSTPLPVPAHVPADTSDRISVRTSAATLLDVLTQQPKAVKAVYLTITASSVELKNGLSLSTDSIERQGDIAQAAKKAGIADYWE